MGHTVLWVCSDVTISGPPSVCETKMNQLDRRGERGGKGKEGKQKMEGRGLGEIRVERRVESTLEVMT